MTKSSKEKSSDLSLIEESSSGDDKSSTKGSRSSSEGNLLNTSTGTGTSSIYAQALTNQDILFTAVEVDGHIQMAFSDRRAETSEDVEGQGDHVTAYINFIEMMVIASDGQNLKSVAGHIKDIAIAIIPDKESIFNEIFNKAINLPRIANSKEYRSEILKKLSEKNDGQELDPELIKITKNALIQSSRQDRIKLITKMVNSFFQQINLDEAVAFTRVGSMEPNHGAEVKKSYHTLKALNDLEGLNPNAINEMTEEALTIKCRSLYKNYIEKRAPYVDGINNVLRTLSGDHYCDVAVIRKDLKDRDLLRDENNPLNKVEKQAFLNILIKSYKEAKNPVENKNIDTGPKTRAVSSKAQKSNELASLDPNIKFISLVSENFGNLFDFKHESHENKKNAFVILGKVTARHLVCMYQTFNSLKSLSPEMRNMIENKFIAEEVLIKQGWSSYDKSTKLDQEALLTSTDVKVVVAKHANLIDFKMKSQIASSAATYKDNYLTPAPSPHAEKKSQVSLGK